MFASSRTCRGSLAGVILACVALIVLMIGCLAGDFCHVLAVQNELQNAADAGALAGAQELWIDVAKCEPVARQISGANLADGRAVRDGGDVTVTVRVDPPNPPASYGKVTVDATMQIRHIFAGVIGRWFDELKVHAAAGTTGKLYQVYADQMFPLAVEESRGNGGLPLATSQVGDVIQLTLNSQGNKNAGWTTLTKRPANARTAWDMIDQRLGLESEIPGFTPSVSIGDDIYLLNGIMASNRLTRGEYMSRLLDPQRPPLILPVVGGDPAMNQTQKVTGFIALRPTNFVFHQSGAEIANVYGRIERLQINGMSGPAGPSTLMSSSLQPGPIQLIE